MSLWYIVTAGDQSLYSKTGACSVKHSAHSNNATWPAERLTIISIPSYAFTNVTVVADFDDSAYCRALTMTVV